MITFYIDENVHRGITNGLRIKGVDILTVQEDGRTGIQMRKIDFIGVIYAHKLRVSVGGCIHDLEIIAKAGSLEELANRVQFLPL